MKQLLQRLKNSILFLWLLPVFFVLHGYSEFYPLLPARECIILIGFYLLFELIFFGATFLFFRDKYKAAVFVFVLFSINFFFGVVHDWIKTNYPGSLPGRYSFILPAISLLIIVLAIILKRYKKSFPRIIQYFNFLLILLIAADLIAFIFKKPAELFKSDLAKEGFTNCGKCNKPDIFYIIADEYAGEKQLQEVFSFDNKPFIEELRKKGFHIVEDSRSNYNYTMFSAPSILNMDFIYGTEGYNQSVHDKGICMDIMKNNRVFRFFEMLGYKTYNYSIFDIAGQPTMARPSFLPVKTRSLTSQTLYSRIEQDLWYHLITDLHLTSVEKLSLYNNRENNKKFVSLTKEIAAKKNRQPKFVYTHLMMPHYPYYYNKDGAEIPYEQLGTDFDSRGDMYISYLQYCNSVFLDLIDNIKSSSPTPPVIIFMSDHGFKSFENNKKSETYFTNFNAVYFPDSNYSQFYNGMSNVNQFRVLLNSKFDQKIPLLKDSTSFLKEKKN